jgi:tRNA (guanine37-N1)-methyltransferase
MECVKVKLKDAQKVKELLIKKKIFDNSFLIKKDETHIYYPIKGTKKLKLKDIEFTDCDFEKKEQKKTFKEIVEESLTKEELMHFKAAFDTVGTVAIIEVDHELRYKEAFIAKILIENVPNIKTVLAKDSMHEGEFRTQKLRYITGDNTKEATYRENGVVMKLNLEEVYFSPRLAEERKRMIGLVKPGERVLVMFSGCAPYALAIAKNTKARDIYGIEINPVGHKYGLENVKFNKLEKKIKLFQGDVKAVVPKLLEQDPELKFDRIIMPLPRDAEEFLYEVTLVSKPGTIVHFYNFVDEEGFPQNVISIIDRYLKALGVDYKVINSVKCGQYSPRKFRVCVDFKIL